ncbi:MAG TPA: glycosyltransferase [Solirubrobacteraceae bacterium]|jgi:glycosyltransferase involved in cell wall biosynthesis
MKVLIVAEYYPRADDPTLGIWAHRQAVAARDAGAEVRVLVLHRPVPPLAALRALDLGAARRALAQPRTLERDGLRIDYMPYVSPPRPWSYASWGAWAAPLLRRALARIRRRFGFELVHAHYAVPAGDAVRRAAAGVPLLVSVHGGDVYGPHSGARTVRTTLAQARIVLANSAGTARRCLEHGAAAAATRVVHLGADLPAPTSPADPRPPGPPRLVTVGNLIERKRHADVVAALPALRRRIADIRYVIVGDGPRRAALLELASSLGVADIVELRGRLPHDRAVELARSAALFVLPSVDEAFGVSYIEAMAGGVPAIGSRGEDGPEEIAAAGDGIALVAPGDPVGLAERIGNLLGDPGRLAAMGRAARATVQREFTWERCGQLTVEAYADALER